jgi:LL-H family phage holin
MTVTEFLFQLTLLVISFAVPVATTFVVKYLQTKLGNEKLKKYINYAETAVKAAETIYNSNGQGSVKKADVEKYLSAKIGNVLSPEDIDKLIEAAVYEINKTGQKVIYDNIPFVQTGVGQ